MKVWLASASLAAAFAIACSSGSSAPATPTAATTAPPAAAAPTVTSLSVTGTAPTVGATAPFTATAALSNGTSQNVTTQATWQSSNQNVASVNTAGVVTGIGAGQTDISATYQGVAGRTSITVTRSSAGATFAVSGMVTDATSGGVLPGIAISTSDGKSTTTNGIGNYTIGGVTSGNVTVTASATGYQTATRIIDLFADARDVNFVLSRVSAPAPSPSPSPSPSPTPSPVPTPPGGSNQCTVPSPIAASCGTATAVCNDQTYSCSQNRSGTCSSHGGVSCWICPGPLCNPILAPAGIGAQRP